jgi:excisionase family DNA binding protein
LSIAEVQVGVGQAARLMQVDPATVRKYAKSGALPVATMTPGGHRRFSYAAIEAFLSARRAANEDSNGS